MNTTYILIALLTWTTMNYFVLNDIKREVNELKEELKKINNK